MSHEVRLGPRRSGFGVRGTEDRTHALRRRFRAATATAVAVEDLDAHLVAQPAEVCRSAQFGARNSWRDRLLCVRRAPRARCAAVIAERPSGHAGVGADNLARIENPLRIKK